ncbi:hypothetical protein B0J13DRAFT_637079 [Dactylonectria estremocensis]|uniref:2EXR domain-containing protein n=1 Tax=Dactylonectria estremocensis TaxID=1079267 RepID=A0A9P9EQK9_9HYPO|nr:hypothetical protein B0J13DRAFT_637079 [Dactylonectria estremocensis]
MHDEFHRFLELPWELREDIWRLTIRPACPGVHHFTIYNNQVDEDASLNEMEDIVTTHEGYPSTRLAAPRWGPRAIGHHFLSQEHTASWTSNNPSTYLIDAGLWTACKESRFVIEHEFQSQIWDSDFRSSCTDLNVTFEGKELAREMACFKEKNPSKRRYFTVFTKQDIFYLQPHDLETLDWKWTTSYYPELNWSGFRNMSHVALDFDVTWALELLNHENWYTDMMHTLARLAIDAGTDGSVEFLWLIDYGIKRKSKNHDEGFDDVAVFRQGDRRFVEMGWRNGCEWETCHVIESSEGEDVITCLTFADSLNNLIDDLCHTWNYEPTGDTPAQWGVLACEHY